MQKMYALTIRLFGETKLFKSALSGQPLECVPRGDKRAWSTTDVTLASELIQTLHQRDGVWFRIVELDDDYYEVRS